MRDIEETRNVVASILRDRQGRVPYVGLATDIVEAIAPMIEAQVRAQIAADIEAEAVLRATKRDGHRTRALELQREGNERGHKASMDTAKSFRSEVTGLYDAAHIARGDSGE